MTAEFLMVIGGCSVFFLTVVGVKTRELRENYAIMWLVVAFIALLAGLFPGSVIRWAYAIHLSGPSAVLFVALPIIYVFSFYLCVVLTRLQRRNARLLQEVAILRNRVLAMEREGPFQASSPPAPPSSLSPPSPPVEP
jgi:hypothetical protein